MYNLAIWTMTLVVVVVVVVVVMVVTVRIDSSKYLMFHIKSHRCFCILWSVNEQSSSKQSLSPSLSVFIDTI